MNPARWLVDAARRVSARAQEQRLTAAIVLPLGGAIGSWMVRTQFDLLRRRGSNPALEASPHVSLKLGFKVPDLEPVAEWLERLAREIPPLELELRGLGRFDEGIVYVAVVPRPELELLRRRILRELRTEFGIREGRFEGDEFTFHASLAHGLPRAVLDDEMDRLASADVAFREVSRFVELWAHVGTHWVTYRRAALSGQDVL